MEDDILERFIDKIWEICRKLKVEQLFLTIKNFFGKGHSFYASALAFNTIMAIVPIVALLMAIANGFGLSVYVEDWLREVLSSQPQTVETLISLAKNSINNARGSTFIGVGIVIMVVSVCLLIMNIETIFNEIWNADYSRSTSSTIAKYVSMVFIVPIVIIIFSGLFIFIETTFKQLESYELLAPVVRFIIFLIPLFVTILIFTAMFVLIPNTNVKIRTALLPGAIAGVIMFALQKLYVYAQALLTGYNAVYGSLAALPLFMLWMHLTWYVCLLCVELNYEMQNYEHTVSIDESPLKRNIMSAKLMQIIFDRCNNEEKPSSALELKEKTGLPIRVVNELLTNLCKANILTANYGYNGNEEKTYLPVVNISEMTFGKMTERLDKLYIPPKHSVEHKSEKYKKEMEELTRFYEEKYASFIQQLDEKPVLSENRRNSRRA